MAHTAATAEPGRARLSPAENLKKLLLHLGAITPDKVTRATELELEEATSRITSGYSIFMPFSSEIAAEVVTMAIQRGSTYWIQDVTLTRVEGPLHGGHRGPWYSNPEAYDVGFTASVKLRDGSVAALTSDGLRHGFKVFREQPTELVASFLAGSYTPATADLILQLSMFGKQQFRKTH